jgi:hypothetical protein
MKRVVSILITIAILAALVARPSAAAVTTNIKVPFILPFNNPCNGDPTVNAGQVHVLATTFDAAGVHTEVHFNEQRARDTDLLTGVVCVDTGELNENSFTLFAAGDYSGNFATTANFSSMPPPTHSTRQTSFCAERIPSREWRSAPARRAGGAGF